VHAALRVGETINNAAIGPLREAPAAALVTKKEQNQKLEKQLSSDELRSQQIALETVEYAKIQLKPWTTIDGKAEHLAIGEGEARVGIVNLVEHIALRTRAIRIFDGPTCRRTCTS